MYFNFLFPTLFSSLLSSTESFMNYFSLVFLSFINSELLLGQVKVCVFAICVWLFCKLQEFSVYVNFAIESRFSLDFEKIRFIVLTVPRSRVEKFLLDCDM